ncbi:hypothetical protein, partial [Aeromonas hydrophila]
MTVLLHQGPLGRGYFEGEFRPGSAGGQHCQPSVLQEDNGIYGHSRFCNTDFDDKLACLNLSGV